MIALQILGAWLALGIILIPAWMLIKRRDRSYNRAIGWRNDVIDYKRFADGLQHPLGETVETAAIPSRLGAVSTDKLAGLA